jgi:hypothetical protein
MEGAPLETRLSAEGSLIRCGGPGRGVPVKEPLDDPPVPDRDPPDQDKPRQDPPNKEPSRKEPSAPAEPVRGTAQ